jgi:hypothetical protein
MVEYGQPVLNIGLIENAAGPAVVLLAEHCLLRRFPISYRRRFPPRLLLVDSRCKKATIDRDALASDIS